MDLPTWRSYRCSTVWILLLIFLQYDVLTGYTLQRDQEWDQGETKQLPFRCVGQRAEEPICHSSLCYDSINTTNDRVETGCATPDICNTPECSLNKENSLFTCCCANAYCNGKSHKLVKSRWRMFQAGDYKINHPIKIMNPRNVRVAELPPYSSPSRMASTTPPLMTAAATSVMTTKFPTSKYMQVESASSLRATTRPNSTARPPASANKTTKSVVKPALRTMATSDSSELVRKTTPNMGLFSSTGRRPQSSTNFKSAKIVGLNGTEQATTERSKGAPNPVKLAPIAIKRGTSATKTSSTTNLPKISTSQTTVITQGTKPTSFLNWTSPVELVKDGSRNVSIGDDPPSSNLFFIKLTSSSPILISAPNEVSRRIEDSTTSALNFTVTSTPETTLSQKTVLFNTLLASSVVQEMANLTGGTNTIQSTTKTRSLADLTATTTETPIPLSTDEPASRTTTEEEESSEMVRHRTTRSTPMPPTSSRRTPKPKHLGKGNEEGEEVIGTFPWYMVVLAGFIFASIVFLMVYACIRKCNPCAQCGDRGSEVGESEVDVYEGKPAANKRSLRNNQQPYYRVVEKNGSSSLLTMKNGLTDESLASRCTATTTTSSLPSSHDHNHNNNYNYKQKRHQKPQERKKSKWWKRKDSRDDSEMGAIEELTVIDPLLNRQWSGTLSATDPSVAGKRQKKH